MLVAQYTITEKGYGDERHSLMHDDGFQYCAIHFCIIQVDPVQKVLNTIFECVSSFFH